LLVVNTASKCGNTPQYDGLEKLYQEYGPQGLVVLGFPSNDFLGQEPGTEEQIEEFCRLTYGVEFPMFEKTTVKKNNAHPFFMMAIEEARYTVTLKNETLEIRQYEASIIAEVIVSGSFEDASNVAFRKLLMGPDFTVPPMPQTDRARTVWCGARHRQAARASTDLFCINPKCSIHIMYTPRGIT
jgi:glutathione peroxidase-family protein